MGDQLNKQAHAEKQVIEADKILVSILESLLNFVDNLGKATMGLRGGVYRSIHTQGRINSVCYNGCEIGYRLRTGNTIFTREVFIRFEQPIRSIPDIQRDPIVLAVFDVFMMEGQGPIEMDTFKFGDLKYRGGKSDDCLKLSQEFSPLVLSMTPTARGHIKINDDIDKILN